MFTKSNILENKVHLIEGSGYTPTYSLLIF